MNLQTIYKNTALVIMLAGALSIGHAQMTFDFESADQIDARAEASGDLAFFDETTSQSLNGSQSLAFDPSAQDSFRSFTYDLPITIDEGTISVWFYDTVGQGAGIFQWGGSIILEDANDPSDFGAVEINDLPYAGPPGFLPYHASEGSVDRGITADKYDSNGGATRTVGWHEVVFTIGATETTIAIDGDVADEVRAPGSTGTDLRLRFMADSATAGGFDNWTTATDGYPAAPELVYFDDVTFTATAPAAASATLDFEDDNGSGDPEYDSIAQFMVAPAFDETNMRGFVGNFAPTTAQAQSGTNSVAFTGATPRFKNIEIDLSTATIGPGPEVTINFYDSLGQDEAQDKIGAAIILESGTNPDEWIAAEIWNAEYPFSAPSGSKTYYFTARPIPFASGFYSSYFPTRSIGWQTLTIDITATESTMQINGVGADGSNASTVYTGPGLNDNPVLRIMADSPSLGGFNNWQDNTAWTDPESPELDTTDLEVDQEYLFFDDITVPLSSVLGVKNWNMYQ